MSTTIGIKWADDLRDRLKALSALKRRSTHGLMREAIRDYLDREEALEQRNYEADAAWEAYRRSGHGVDSNAMTIWLDCWGTDQKDACPEPERFR